MPDLANCVTIQTRDALPRKLPKILPKKRRRGGSDSITEEAGVLLIRGDAHKGQVVIPEEIRRKLGLEAGAQFLVIGDRDVVILKTLAAPSMKEFDELVGKARKQARQASLKRPDVREAVSREKSRK